MAARGTHAAALDYPDILVAAGEAAYHWDIASDVVTWSDNAAELLGLRDSTSIANGRGFAALLDSANAKTRFDAVMHSTRIDQGSGVDYQLQYAVRSKPRAPKRWIEDSGRWYAGNNGRPARAHGVIRIITDRHEREQQLAYLSRFDPLTGEINRWHLSEQLDKALQDATRAQTECGFLLIAIDSLGQINDAYGYDIADEVIGVVARRLRSTMRTEDCIGRFSGNKFGIILRDCKLEEIGIAAERFLTHMRRDVVTTSAGPITVSGTIGGVIAPRHGGNVHELLARAQETLNHARGKRPGSFFSYQPNVEREAIRRENILASDRIVSALNQKRIVLVYEPVIDAQTQAVAFHECLLRIRGNNGALIAAGEIMPVAERLGLVRLLDQRVLELVIGEMAAQPRMQASVNVSAASTLDPDWWLRLESLLRLHQGVAERLIVEITETTAIHDVDHARGFVTRVKDLGARIAIDDFGAGYTSFRNLRKLGVDMIKIDGAFVRDLVRSPDDRTFVRAMLDLARGLKLKSVAEWVPDRHTADMLADLGCDYLQGEYVGQAALTPVSVKPREKRLAKN